MLPRDDAGSIFLLVDGIILYMFTLIISHIFYKIPRNHGLLVNLRSGRSEDHLSVKFTFYNKQRSEVESTNDNL